MLENFHDGRTTRFYRRGVRKIRVLWFGVKSFHGVSCTYFTQWKVLLKDICITSFCYIINRKMYDSVIGSSEFNSFRRKFAQVGT